MKHEFPKWNKYSMQWESGPTSPQKKRGPKRKGPATRCHICDAWFFSKKQKAKHIQLEHRRPEALFDADGIPFDRMPKKRATYGQYNYPL